MVVASTCFLKTENSRKAPPGPSGRGASSKTSQVSGLAWLLHQKNRGPDKISGGCKNNVLYHVLYNMNIDIYILLIYYRYNGTYDNVYIYIYISYNIYIYIYIPCSVQPYTIVQYASVMCLVSLALKILGLRGPPHRTWSPAVDWASSPRWLNP